MCQKVMKTLQEVISEIIQLICEYEQIPAASVCETQTV